MGRRGFYLVLGCLFVLNQNLARAESTISALLAPALIGMTERKVDLKYSELLKLDPHATVAISLGGGICTGTFLSDVMMITAAHCVNRKDKTGGVNVDGIASLRVYFSELYDGKEENKNRDVAIVIFPIGTGEFLGIKNYPKLSTETAETNKPAFYVGFGADNLPAILLRTGRDGAGIKGWGQGTVIGTKNGLIETEPVRILVNNQPDPNQKKGISSILPGDSGGAVYNEKGEIIGIVSLYGTNPHGKILNFYGLQFRKTESWDLNSYFVDITFERAQEVLALAEEGEKGASDSEPSHPFEHVVLRTGYYQAEDKTKLFVRPTYFGPLIGMLDVADVVDGKVSKMTQYQCDGIMCVDETLKSGFVIGKDTFLHVKISYGFFTGKPKVTSEVAFARAD